MSRFSNETLTKNCALDNLHQQSSEDNLSIEKSRTSYHKFTAEIYQNGKPTKQEFLTKQEIKSFDQNMPKTRSHI